MYFRLDSKLSSSHGKISKTNESALKYLATKTLKKEEDSNVIEDAPVKYSTSAASTFKAACTRSGVKTERLWYEPYVIIGSLTVFMIYFTILREENDLDEELQQTLYDRIEGMEETQLKIAIAYNKEHGGDCSKLIARLEELQGEKEMSKKSL